MTRTLRLRPPAARRVALAAAILCAALGAWPAAAQAVAQSHPTFVSRSWTVADGLPSNAVTDVAQGADGYLWVTTYAGLARFDGVRFTVFTSETTPALPTDRLLGIEPGRGGMLWIRTETLAIVRFDPARMTFARYDAGLEGTQTRTVYEDTDGTLWVGTNAGLFRWQGRRFARVRGLAGSVFAILRDRAGALWVGTTEDGVFRLQNGHLGHFTVLDGLPSGWIDTLVEDADGAVWAGTPRRLGQYAGGRFVTGGQPRSRPGAWGHAERDVLLGGRPVFTAGSDVWSVSGDHEGNGWVATKTDGLVRLHPGLFSIYSELEGLPERYVYSVLEDRTGALWFGTATRGLGRLRGGAVDVVERRRCRGTRSTQRTRTAAGGCGSARTRASAASTARRAGPSWGSACRRSRRSSRSAAGRSGSRARAACAAGPRAPRRSASARPTACPMATSASCASRPTVRSGSGPTPGSCASKAAACACSQPATASRDLSSAASS